MSDIPWNLEYFREPAPPSVPLALPATDITEGSFTANWQAVELATRYWLDVALDPLFANYVAGYRNRSVLGTSEGVTGLVAGTNYYYRVRSSNLYVTSGSSNTINAFTDFILAPVALEASEITDEGFTANWEAVAEAVGYELDVSADEDFGELTPVDAPIALGLVLSHAVSGLAPDAAYFYRVRAVKASGVRSGQSNVIDLQTLELFTAQGGDLVEYDGTYSRHHFTTVGAADFEVLTGARAVRRLLVGGGAMGGGVNGSGVSCGGGGGGGVLDLDETDRPTLLTPDIYPVVVGDAGDTPGANNVGEDGGDTSFDGDTAEGGGHGGGFGGVAGNGGSGGGAVNSSGSNEQGGLGTAGQGNDGGDSPGSGGGGGAGGGGADEVGASGTIAHGGKGGDGIESDITGEAVLYGAGGGGGVPLDPFGPIGGTVAGLGGAGGGGNGRGGSFGPGGAATGIGAGGGGGIGNNPGGIGIKGKAVIKYRGRAADITPPPPEPADYRGPITMDGCTRAQEVDAVDILVDCNARIDSGIYPDYQRYLCIGGGVLKSSRSMRANSLPSQLPDDPLPGGEHGIQNGTLVFRFSEPIRAFKITRRITAGTDAAPILIACDDYTVVPHPTSSVPGSSKDGAIVNLVARSPEVLYYPTVHLEPPVNLAAEEEMELTHAEGFSCVVIQQQTKFPSEFIDPMFILLTD